MLMKTARKLRVFLLFNNFPESCLPNLDGNAGHQWLMRWRNRYRISMKRIGMQMKVSWQKITRRVRVLLTNIFRLRAFFDICHPGCQPRFLSLDQKPSWFNNAGLTDTYGRKGCRAPHVRENFAHTRQRYTILTGVPSWGHEDPDVPPKVAILFKAKPGGRTITRLRACEGVKPWMKIQVQENGSYRSQDVVEALEWMLPQVPDAEHSRDSMIVLLDWFSGHLTEEVADLVKRKGHVLLFHGGRVHPVHSNQRYASSRVVGELAYPDRERMEAIGTGALAR